MGFSRVIYVYCNGYYETCPLKGDEAYGADGGFKTIAEAKESIKADGWRVVGKAAYCPTCWQAKTLPIAKES